MMLWLYFFKLFLQTTVLLIYLKVYSNLKQNLTETCFLGKLKINI